ncbi:hypothetical protein [Sphingomonas sp.]|uniref:hypothetical protein n=1 Tax=Sphingomonas sp. TaxID=28214 RepID=UPI0025D472A7|nr:hypothetical protein [Sphingomonas sp.]
MNSSKSQKPLPPLLNAIAAVDFLAVAMAGGFGLFVLAAFMPYGHPVPSAAAVYLRFTLQFLVVPLVLTACAVFGGRKLHALGKGRLAALALFLPIIGLPFLLMAMDL